MNNSRFSIVVIVGLAFVVLGLSAFTVGERELAIKLQVGKVVEARYDPGLHFKIPVYQTVQKFPSQILKIDDAPQRSGALSTKYRFIPRQVARWKLRWTDCARLSRTRL